MFTSHKMLLKKLVLIVLICINRVNADPWTNWTFAVQDVFVLTVHPFFRPVFGLIYVCSFSEKCQNGVWVRGKCVWECAERVNDKKKNPEKTDIELFVSLFWAPLPISQMSICSPSSKCWGYRWPTVESTNQYLPGHLPICLSHLFISLSDDDPPSLLHCSSASPPSFT